jgi:tRNA(fMet)-specific endonuclease VapC
VIRWLLDTDHISLVERGHPALRTRLEAVPPEAVGVSVVTVEETMRGRLAILSRRAPGASRVHAYAKLMETVRFYCSVPVVPFDDEVEREFETLKAQKIRIGSQDLRIAATARVRRLILVTRNRGDFQQVPGLSIEDWSLPSLAGA